MQDHLHSPTYDNILFDSTYTSLLPPPPHQTYTIGNRHFAECRRLCRVYFIGHSAKTVFAECQIKYARQKKTLDKIRLCRVSFFWHSAKMYFAECYFSAHGKIRLCRVPFSGTRQRCILPSAIFRHTAKCAFAECLFLALGKDVFCRAFVLALGKEPFCRVYFFCSRQISFSKRFLRS